MTTNTYYTSLSKSKSNNPINYTPSSARPVYSSSMYNTPSGKPSYTTYSTNKQMSPITASMYSSMGKTTPYDLSTAPKTAQEYNSAVKSASQNTASNMYSSSPTNVTTPNNGLMSLNTTPRTPTKTVEEYMMGSMNNVRLPNSTSMYSSNVTTQPRQTSPIINREFGTGALTKTEMLTAGNTNKISPSQATVMDILSNFYNPSQSELDSLVNRNLEQYKSEANAPIDEETVRKSFRDRIQGQLDAINQAYSSMLASQRVTGANNKGINRAINARSGMLGSTFGASTESAIDRTNLDVEKSIESERMGALNSLMNESDNQANSYIDTLRGQKIDAQNNLMNLLQTRETRTAGQASKLAQALLAKGVSLNSLTDQDFKDIQTQYGVDPGSLIKEIDLAQYNKAQQDMTLNKGRYQNISDGAMMYDTLTGKMVENPKTQTGSTQNIAGYGTVAGIDDAMQRIANTESAGSKDRFGGNDQYQVVSVPSANGDRAYGKYQVMGANIPVWTKEVLGQSLSVEQFLNSPQAQDMVARAKLQESYNKYGTWEDSASVWFSGRPMAGNTSRDVLGTSTPDYIQKFLGGNNKVSPEVQTWVDTIIANGGSPEDYIKGTSVYSNQLRNSVQSQLNRQGYGTGQNISSGEYNTLNTLLSNINKIDTESFGSVSGLIMPITNPTQSTYIDNLIANLSLDAREKLKGSGSISDYEAKQLGTAVSILNNKRIDPAAAQTALEEIRGIIQGKVNKYQSGQSGQNPINNQNIINDDPLGLFK